MTNYVERHKHEIFGEFEQWYAQHHHGTLRFEDIKVSALSNLPNLSFELDGIQLIDTLYQKHQTETLKLERLTLVLSLQKLMKKEIQFKEIKIKGLDFKMITDVDGYDNHGVIKPKVGGKKPKGKHSSSWFAEEQVKFKVTDSRFLLEDHLKHKHYAIKIDGLDGSLAISDTLVLADLNLDLVADELAFNTKKGSFLNGARLRGNPKLSYHIQEKQLQLPFFDLAIGPQSFNIKTEMDFMGEGKLHLVLNNPQTNYQEIMGLIPESIVQKLNKFQLKEPFSTKTNLYAKLGPKSNPRVTVDLETQNNTLTISDTLAIENLAFKGKFVNRLYDDERAYHESPKDLRLDFHLVEADVKGAHIKGENLQYTSSETLENFVKAHLKVTGKAKDVNNFINAKDMVFDDGDYELETILEGDLGHIDTLLRKSTCRFISKNLKIFDNKTGLLIPAASFDLLIENEDAFLNELKIALPNTQDTIRIRGEINNLTSLIFKGEKQTNTSMTISSEKLRWKDFQNLFKNLKSDTIAVKKPKTNNVMVSLLGSIERKFNPKITIELGQYGQQNVQTKDFSTSVFFEGDQKIRMQDMNFNYRGSDVSLSLDLYAEDPKKIDFSVKFITENLPILQLLNDFDYFGLEALKNIEKLDGLVNLDVELKGSLDEKTGLDEKSLTGAMVLDIEQLVIKGFEPLEKAASKVFRKERFEDIKFAPINDKFYLKNQTLEIPQLELQSTAFDFFVEGHLSFKGENNIWLSIPLANLKHRDLHDFPEKVGYVDAGKKVFVEVKNNGDDGKLGYHFHLTNKKLYEEKGILSQYKAAHKSERKLRRQQRRETRKQNRAERHEVLD